MISIAITDDHEMIRLGLTSALQDKDDIKILGTYLDGVSLLDAYPQMKPDVVLLDFRLANETGDEVLKKLLEIDCKARVIMLTAFEQEEYIWRAATAGACGYLLKSSSGKTIYEAIKVVASGETYYPDAMQDKLDFRRNRAELTPRETQVLQLLASGLSNKMIMERLKVSMPTVKSHVSKLMVKMEASDRTDAVGKGLRRGLVSLGGLGTVDTES